MSEESLDRMIRAAARTVNVPPAAPVEEMWAEIREARERDELRRRRRRWVGRTGWGIGIAAMLALAVGLGRWSARSPAAAGPVAVGEAAPAGGAAYRIATVEHLSQAEALLTLTRGQAHGGELDAQTVAWARDLLATTRLLLDSPASQDARLHALLEDLELVLAEISQLPTDAPDTPAATEELDLVRKSIEQGGVLPRIRAAIPSGTPTVAS